MDSEYSTLREEVKFVVNQNPSLVEEYRNGDESALNRIIAEVMKETEGQFDADEIEKSVKDVLSGKSEIEYPVELTKYVKIGDNVSLLEKLWSEVRDDLPEGISINEESAPDALSPVTIEITLLIKEPVEVHNRSGEPYKKSDIEIVDISHS